MTEKRYKIDLTNSPVLAYIDMITGKKYPITEKGIYSICDLLNGLHEENQQLKRDMKGYESNYEMFKEQPILFVGGVPYVSVGEIHKQAELVVLREKERIKNGDVDD